MQVTRTRPLFLNLDDDERLLKPSDMRYAINVETATSYDDDSGALEKSKAPVLVDYSLPTGDNKCIGTVVSEQVNNIYIFIYNSNQNHRIYEYNDQYEVTEIVLESSELNFTEYSNIVGEAVRGRDVDEILLYFTDNVNPIRQLNVNRAKDGGYGTIDQEKISLIKYQPNKAPTFKFTTDHSYQRSNISNKVYQFRCRYLCLDNEYTSYSSNSKLAFTDTQLNGYLFGGDYFDVAKKLNNIKISVPTGSSIVDKIEVIARIGNVGEWFVINEVPNDTSVSEITFDFKDDGAYPAADPQETLKPFDNVPIQAESLSVVSNRLWLGNYVDGYDLNESIAKASDNDISVKPYFQEVGEYSFISANQISKNNQSNTIVLNYDYSSFSSFQDDDVIELNGSGNVTLTSGSSYPLIGANFSYLISSNDTLSNVLNQLSSNINGTTIPSRGFTINYSSFVSGNNIIVTIEFDDRTGSSISTENTSFSSGLRRGFGGVGATFKAGTYYKVGIIEYDEAMRASTVNTFAGGDVYIPSYSEVDIRRFSRKGRAFLDYRIAPSITPEPRTKYWRFAVTENNTQEDFLTYSVTYAYIGTSDPKDVNAIYLNLRGLVGDEDSYVDSSGALIDATFTKGDRVRVLSYIDDSGNRVEPKRNIDFKVVEAQFYGGEDSPIYDTNDPIRTTGYLLKCNDPNIDRWDYNSIASTNSFWQKSGGSVIVEIYRPKAKTLEGDEVFYEIGDIKEVVNNQFQGDIRSANQSLSYNLSGAQGSNFYQVSGNTVDFVIGDVIVERDSQGNDNGFAFIVDIVREGGSTYIYVNTTFSPGSNGSIALAEKHSAGRIEGGDAWYRLRRIRNDNNNGTGGSLATFITYPVIDSSVSDFIGTKAWSRGRPKAYDPLAQETERPSDITYSNTYFQDVNYNGLSSFDLSQGNFKSYPFDSGAIHRLWRDGNFLMMFQENDVARIPINNNIISTSDQQDSLALSNKVIGQERYYAAGYGLTNKDMFAAIDGRFYGYDIKRGKAWEINGQGHTLISEYKVQSHFDVDSKQLVSFHNFIDMSIGIDKENDKVLFGTVSKGADNINVGSTGTSNSYVPGLGTNGTNLQFKATPKNTKGGKASLATLNQSLSTYSQPLSNPSTAPQNLNNIVRTGVVQYGSSSPQTSGTQQIQVVTPTTGGSVTLNGILNLANGTVSLPQSQTAGTLSTAGNTINYNGFVLGYNYKANRWVSFYSFSPEHFTNINYSVFSFDGGAMYKLNTGNSYPSSPTASFEVIFNKPGYSVKRYRTIGVSTSEDSSSESELGWDVNLYTNLNEANLAGDLFEKKEGEWRVDMPRTTSVSGTSAMIGLGDVSSISGSEVFITGLDTDSIGISAGDTVSNQNDQTISTIGSITKNSVKLNNVSGVNVGDFLFAEKPAFIDGDELRGYFLRVRFNASGGGQNEVYAVSVLQQESRLHNL